MGAAQEHHTSLLVDLSNRPYYFTFLDINVPSGHVPGSTLARVAVSGDTICPIPTLDPSHRLARQRLASPTTSSTQSLNLPTVSICNSFWLILNNSIDINVIIPGE